MVLLVQIGRIALPTSKLADHRESSVVTSRRRVTEACAYALVPAMTFGTAVRSGAEALR